MEPFKVIVCGDRYWKDREPILRELKKLPAGTLIIHGAAPGADTIAGQIAEELNLPVEAHPAMWEHYGRAAGPIRNQFMLDQGPDLVLAFHRSIEESRGTRDMVNRARNKGIKAEVFKE